MLRALKQAFIRLYTDGGVSTKVTNLAEGEVGPSYTTGPITLAELEAQSPMEDVPSALSTGR
jgi:hypothetical protein